MRFFQKNDKVKQRGAKKLLFLMRLPTQSAILKLLLLLSQLNG